MKIRHSALALAFTLCAWAQVDTGRIQGIVADSSSASVPGAKVSITNEGTGLRQTMTTQQDGGYVFSSIRIGSYTVEVESAGFQKARRTGVTVNIQQQAVVNFSLSPGEITTTIDVSDALPVLQTQNGSVGETVTAAKINNLPLSGRNYNFLARLTAGVTHPQPEGRGLNATGWFVANGTRPAQNNFLLDGIDNNSNNVDFLTGAAYVLKPPVDAIGEFKLQTSSFSAEFGRAGGAVLNASLKSGSNAVHGSAWEFLRNEKLDAADFFVNANNQKRAPFRQNQFGAAIGGPIKHNKTFFFADYEGTRIRQQVPWNTNVPTLAQRSSRYTNFSDLMTLQSNNLGVVYDPSTTVPLAAGGWERQPFPGNQIPGGRLNPNAIRLLDLYPAAPTNAALNNNYFVQRGNTDDTNAFDVRLDHNFSERDQIFGRYSFADIKRFKPGPFDGVADGGGFNNGDETVRTQGAAISYTHTFAPTLINEMRAGFNREHSNRQQPFANELGIPEKYGIQGILQTAGNGGLPGFSIGGLSALGPTDWIISERFSNTVQLSNNLTKIYGSHTFKGGWEGQLIDFPWKAPPTSRGRFSYSGTYTSVPNRGDGSTGRAQFLLQPPDAAGTGGYGANSVGAANFGGVSNRKYYTGLYFQDDWKVSRKLTLNLGLRWDFFSLVGERYDAQANFVPQTSEYYIPQSRQGKPNLSPSFLQATARDGIKIVYSDKYGSGLGTSQRNNFAPRFGFAYQASPKLVVRGGYGLYYGAFENRGGSPNLGYNYPFQFTFAFNPDNAVSSVRYGDGSIATIERGLAAVPMDPTLVNGFGLNLRAIEFKYRTPYTQGANLFVQYEAMKNTSVEVGWVASLGRHIETFLNHNLVSQILTPNQNPQNFIRYPSFARGSSYATTSGNSHYHALQSKVTRRFNSGLDLLATYTFAKTLTNAGDLLNGGDIGGFRGPGIPGMGMKADMALASFHINHAFTFNGSYQLPFGRGRKLLANANGLVNGVLGGWSANWILSAYSGTPITIGCANIATTAGAGCNALLTGENPYIGRVDQFLNSAAFKNPPVATAIGQTDFAPLGGQKSQVTGPPFRKLDFSVFKDFPVRERYRFQLRVESFNLTNTPAFAAPSFRNFADTRNFGRITSTRNNPNDARQLQLALKFYW